jgi:hypothetical protein
MVQHLPKYLLKSDVGVFSVLPSDCNTMDMIVQMDVVKKEEEETCFICMNELAVCFLMCFTMLRILYFYLVDMVVAAITVLSYFMSKYPREPVHSAAR